MLEEIVLLSCESNQILLKQRVATEHLTASVNLKPYLK